MKNLLLILLLCSSANAFSQPSREYKKFVEQIKKDAKTDKNDKTVYNLLHDFYEQALQSDAGELQPDVSQRIQTLYADKNAKNLQILTLFLTYQEHVSQNASNGSQPDPALQMLIMSDLASEIKNTYDTVPVIIKIYQAETLSSNGQPKEAADLISKSLVEFPNSIPLKVYTYLDTKDEKIKADLIKNHSNHWMVQQFGIK